MINVIAIGQLPVLTFVKLHKCGLHNAFADPMACQVFAKCLFIT